MSPTLQHSIEQMAFTLDQVVPWGRNLDEYRRMFALDDVDMHKRVLGCGDGPASFNAEMHQRGCQVVSVDPTYRFRVEQIKGRIAQTRQQVMDQLLQNVDSFVWETIPTPQDLERIRLEAMDVFLQDFTQGMQENRYIAGELPKLDFDDHAFDLALCSHFLFLYSEQLTLDFHRAAIQELCRVAREVRIFPLRNLAVQPSPYVQPIVDELGLKGYTTSIEKVDYEFQRGANTMLRITQQREDHGNDIAH
jgi:hypothetical protein